MKTRKTIFGIMALLAIVTIGFIACDNGDEETPEQPQFRSEEITLNFLQDASFLLGYEDKYSDSIMVSGTLLASEWNGIPLKVKTIIEAAYPKNPQTMDDLILQNELTVGSFAKLGANVIVEKTTAYTNYKIIGDGKTLYLNFSIIDSISVETIIEAVKKMTENETHSN
jgi:hypothetical protein